MSGAGGALTEVALVTLGGIEGLNGVFDGPPLTAAFPFARIETGPEIDWSHKSGEGRELRLAILVRDKCERPQRLRNLADAVEAAMAGLAPELAGWRLISLVFLRRSVLRDADAAWSAAIEYRARLLKA